MLPDRVSNPEPLTYESGALPIALRGPAQAKKNCLSETILLRCHKIFSGNIVTRTIPGQSEQF